jgi:hypothetical protein
MTHARSQVRRTKNKTVTTTKSHPSFVAASSIGTTPEETGKTSCHKYF